MAIQPDRKAIPASTRNYGAVFSRYAYVAPNEELSPPATPIPAQKHCLQPPVIIPRPKQRTLLWTNLFTFSTMSPAPLLVYKKLRRQREITLVHGTLAERQFE